MSQKNVVLRGAFFLTAAGIAGRLIGFFYKIFLSRMIGAQGMGIYQLVFPLYALAASLTASGMQTSISRFVSAKTASGDRRGASRIFVLGLSLSLALSLAVSGVLFHFHDLLAASFIKEVRCSELVRLLAFALPFGSIHACTEGYYYGLKRTKIPAASQILEHLVRFAALLLLSSIWTEKGIPLTPSLAVYCIIISEGASALFCALAVSLHFSLRSDAPAASILVDFTDRKACLPAPTQRASGAAPYRSGYYLRELLSLCVPLTLNRVAVNLLQSLEAFLIPLQLQLASMTSSEALGIYGILTGMAMPLIFFPNAITSSVATMLLPVVSEAQARKEKGAIIRAIKKTCFYCVLLGIFCWLSFLLCGDLLGQLLFHSALAGSFITSLSWICPLFYLNPALFAILNGLGYTGSVFFHNMAGILTRILFILLAVPHVGILGYFWGLVAAQLVITALSVLALKKKLRGAPD